MLIALILVVICLVLYLACRRPATLPPGVWGLPVVGKLPTTSVDLCTQVDQLRNTYGDIIMWRMGSQINVFLCDYKIIKKVFARPEFSYRPEYFTYSIWAEGQMLGIIFGNGEAWKKSRRFALRQLRDLGMGKTRLEEAIQYEATCLVHNFRQHTGKAQHLPMSVGVAVLNIIWKMVADTRYEMEDPKAHKFIRLVQDVCQSLQGPVFIFNLFPILLHLAPPFLKKKLGYYTLKKITSEIIEFVSEFIEDHKATLNPSQPRDLIDHILLEQKSNNNTHTPTSYDEEMNMRVMISDLFFAGAETTTAMVHWSICYLIKYPHVQHKIQKEIDASFPKGTLPYYSERNKLPYLEATIHEIHRIVSLTPMSVAHSVTQDTQLEGYTLPKGTVVLAYTESCHRNPLLWERPHQFYPEHFLNTDGSFKSRTEGFMPFGTGRRSCAGESLAKVELFVLLVALLQNFTFTKPPGESITTEKDPNVIIINTAKPFNVIITERQ
ncbi:hypothetical protein Pcinc_014773 [Petrolisthes cinctipes]|uniref:Cytochrome P450 n=1 Tax=Petrolisthes cinctipes TaxID=88211 RepID=A0AAE1FW87_PETCI|nr:hypothetical protein Pcinc_034210 [Petrolisthes cinctipes]KAK3880760.1 hypothetical protein Pcinc_014773 [Petrolisthes cinctipes]